MSRILFEGYQGLGDQFFQRPFILEALKRYDEVYLSTPFPDLFYKDTGVKCVYKKTGLKTPCEHYEKVKHLYCEYPQDIEIMTLDYARGLAKKRSILNSFRNQTGIYPTDYSFKVPNAWKERAERFMPITEKKICVVKLPTIREEWKNISRNPKMEYFNHLIERYKDEYCFVSIANNHAKEYFDGEYPKGIEISYNSGELSIEEYIGFMSLADLNLCYNSNALQIGLALGIPTISLFGGYVSSEMVTDSIMGLENYIGIEPSQFCYCYDRMHKCNKEIDLAYLNMMADKIARK